MDGMDACFKDERTEGKMAGRQVDDLRLARNRKSERARELSCQVRGGAHAGLAAPQATRSREGRQPWQKPHSKAFSERISFPCGVIQVRGVAVKWCVN